MVQVPTHKNLFQAPSPPYRTTTGTDDSDKSQSRKIRKNQVTSLRVGRPRRCGSTWQKWQANLLKIWEWTYPYTRRDSMLWSSGQYQEQSLSELEVWVESEYIRRIMGYRLEQLLAPGFSLDILNPAWRVICMHYSYAQKYEGIEKWDSTWRPPDVCHISIWTRNPTLLCINLAPMPKGLIIHECEEYPMHSTWKMSVAPRYSVRPTGFNVPPEELERSTASASKHFQ